MLLVGRQAHFAFDTVMAHCFPLAELQTCPAEEAAEMAVVDAAVAATVDAAAVAEAAAVAAVAGAAAVADGAAADTAAVAAALEALLEDRPVYMDIQAFLRLAPP